MLGSSAVTTEKPPNLPAADPLQELSQAHDVTLKRTAPISGCQAALWNKQKAWQKALQLPAAFF